MTRPSSSSSSTTPLWTPFSSYDDDASSTRVFFDPYEGRNNKRCSGGAFHEDPFANSLPYNGWCRVPRFQTYARQNRASRMRRWKEQQRQQRSKERNEKDAPSVSYQSYRTRDAESPSTEGTDDDDLSSDVSEEAIHRLLRLMEEPALPTISETTVTTTPPTPPVHSKQRRSSKSKHAAHSKNPAAMQPQSNNPTSSSSSGSRHDLEKLAQARAVQKLQYWLHDTGLVDDFFMDPNSLPHNKRSLLMMNRKNTFSDRDSITTTLSQEGFEIGPHGHTLESEQVSQKVLEFQATTLRELNKVSQQVAQQQQQQQQSSILELQRQQNYPKPLQEAQNAQFNLERVVVEVDFFDTITDGCQRLWAELSSALTTNASISSSSSSQYWSKVHDIVQDHVTMQSFLVELVLEWMNRFSHELPPKVEQLLRPKVLAVQELGTELKLQLLSQIGVAFGEGKVQDLTHIVGAIQLYEDELEQIFTTNKQGYNKKQLRRAKSMMVIGMDELALEAICNDCEVRGHELFQVFFDEAADDAASTNVEHANMEATLKACRTMAEAMQIIKTEVIPIFPKRWPVLTIWSSCLGSICSQYIFQQIGGPEGNKLPVMTPDQMLRLMSWIEEFKHLTEYPTSKDEELSKLGSRFFVSIQDIIKTDMVNSSTHLLTTVLSILWEIHRLVEDHFIIATQEKTDEWLNSVFEADHSKNQMGDGRLITSLPEDVWVLARVQLNAIQEHFTPESTVFFHACCMIFRCMHKKVRKVWRGYLQDVETCCAAANDAVRMIELADVELEEIREESDFTEAQFGEVEAIAEVLRSQFINDAVFSAMSVHRFIFDPIDQALRGRLFEPLWEELTYNDLAVTIVRTMEDYLSDLERWLEENMLRKALDALARAAVNFYIRHLLLKSIRRTNHTFQSVQRAMQRISGDIALMEDFFESWIAKFPALERVLEHEFEILYAVVELLEIGAGLSMERDPTDFFPFMQKKLRKVEATKFVCCQLWHLLSIEGGRLMRDMFEANRHHLMALEGTGDKEPDPTLELTNVVLEVMMELKESLKVKTVVRNARSSIVVQGNAVKKRVNSVIDRLAEV